MGLTDFITKTLKGGKKSPSLTSRSLTSKSMVSSSVTKKASPQSRYLGSVPNSWNKDNYHCVMIEDNGKLYTGYIWVSDRWVEVHLFGKLEIKKGEEFNDVEKGYFVPSYEGDGRGVKWGRARVYVMTTPYIPMYKRHKESAIVARNNVGFFTSHKKFTGKYEPSDWIEGIIKVSISSADINRWNQWHPANDFKTELREKARYTHIEDRYRVLTRSAAELQDGQQRKFNEEIARKYPNDR